VSANTVSLPDPFCYCPDGEPAPDDNSDTKIVGPTNASGVIVATFDKVGGYGNMEFYATIGTVTAGPSTPIFIANFDNAGGGVGIGDCKVNLTDFGEFAQDYFGTAPRSDYNCDGSVNLTDFGEFAKHYFHNCTTPNP
jgi:hypothetical protein